MSGDGILPGKANGVWPGMETLRAMDCAQLEACLTEHWSGLAGVERDAILFIMVDKGCQNAVPHLLRQLESDDPYLRNGALSGLCRLGRHEYRGLFVRHHLQDPDPGVRSKALHSLSVLFARRQDGEILRLALAAFDDPGASLESRVRAADAMLLQLEQRPGLGDPPYWRDDEEETLQHPAMVWAVGEARRLVALEGHDTRPCPR